MLNTQYRMHPSLCVFPSREFYESKLQTATHCNDIELPYSAFPWPVTDTRAVFIQVSTPEDLGSKSKSNTGQGKMCQEIVHLLRSPRASQITTPLQPPYSIAILTPYTRQAMLLKNLLPDGTISSIDGFQGQEADVIAYITVRCNLHREIGFLKDTRRLNVALTRAKAGLIVIGDEDTLVGKGIAVMSLPSGNDSEQKGKEEETNQGQEYHETWKRLTGCLTKMKLGTRDEELTKLGGDDDDGIEKKQKDGPKSRRGCGGGRGKGTANTASVERAGGRGRGSERGKSTDVMQTKE